jgi:serine/threonine protein kinase
MTPARSTTTRTHLGRYELLKEIAATGVASIWVAKLIDTGKEAPRAFSFLRLQRRASKNLEVVAALSKSARRAQKLQHPNAVEVIEMVISDGEMAIIGEHIEGESLAALRLDAGPTGLPSSVCLRIALDVLAALAAAHELSEPLLHGDLNPHHIVVGAEGVARVTGFGVVATLANLGTHEVKNLERLGYVAPERVKAVAAGDDGRSATVASDLYSLGVLLWEGLAQRRLFASKIEAAVVQKVMTAPIPRLSSLEGLQGPKLGEAVSDVLEKALNRDPSQRYATARELSAALEAAAGSSIGSAADVKAHVDQRFGDVLRARHAELTKLLSTEDAVASAPKAPAAAEVKSEPSGAKAGRAEVANKPSPGRSLRSQTLMGLTAPGTAGPIDTSSASKTPAPRPVGLVGARLPPRASARPIATSSSEPPETTAAPEAKPAPTPSSPARPERPATPRPAPVEAEVDVEIEAEPESLSTFELVPMSDAAPTSLGEVTRKIETPIPASALDAVHESEPSAPPNRDAEALLPAAGGAAPWDVVEPASSDPQEREQTLQRPPPSPLPKVIIAGGLALPETGDPAPSQDGVAPRSSDDDAEDREQTLQRPPPSPATPGYDARASATRVTPDPLDDSADDLLAPTLAKRRQLTKLVVGGVLAGLTILLGLAIFMRADPPTKAPAQSALTAAPTPEARPSEPTATPQPTTEALVAPAAVSAPVTAAEASAPAVDATATTPPPPSAPAAAAPPPPSATTAPAPTPPNTVKPGGGPTTSRPTKKPAAPKPKYNPTGI